MNSAARTPADYAGRSLWLEQVGDLDEDRPILEGRERADVAIVGGGLTGIWAAYYLSVLAPELSITVVERETVGFGASGRNGGWAGAGIAGSASRYRRTLGRDGVVRATRATNDAVDEIGRVVTREQIDCGWIKSGTLVAATTKPQLERLHRMHEDAQAQGTWSHDEVILDPEGVLAHARIPDVRGGMYTPHCASFNPARLVRGLARVCEARGVRIFEHSAATALAPGRVGGESGEVLAPVVLRATEAFTTQLPGHRRDFLPLTSLMIATEPLPADVWDDMGIRPGLTVRDRRHLFFYARRTEDDRLVIGGRGAPYRWGSPIDESNERNEDVRLRLSETLQRHFPAARDARITHHWGGTLAVPRDWSMSVSYDPGTGIGSAGGYSGHGVVASNISGRTLADLVLGRSSELVDLPWVGHRSGRWEPEPLRYLASRAIVGILLSADRHEDRTDRSATRVRLVQRFLPPT